MDQIGRRAFVKGGIGVAAGAALAGPFQGFVAHAAGAAPSKVPDLGPLGPVADARDGVVRLHLPPGFQYRSFHDNQAVPRPTLDGGAFVPGRHDGMAAFAGPTSGTVTLIRNHEINSFGTPFAAGVPVYDARGPGGTTSTVVDLQGNVQSAVASLTGTQMNCAGGRMPWGAWVTCEETVNGPDVFDDFTRGPAPPTTLRPEQGAAAEARVHLRSPGERRRLGRADHPRRAVRSRGGGVRPEGRRALPDGRRLRLPQRLLQVRAAGPSRPGRADPGRRPTVHAGRGGPPEPRPVSHPGPQRPVQGALDPRSTTRTRHTR